MTKPAVMKGTYVDLRFMPGLKVARVSIDIPIEMSNEFLTMFGAPDRANPVWCVVARLVDAPLGANKENGPDNSGCTTAREPHEAAVEGQDRLQRTIFREMPRSQQAALKCQDEAFQEWLIIPRLSAAGLWTIEMHPSLTTDAEYADYILKSILGITSKRELDTDPTKGEAFDRLLASFDYRDRT